MGKMHEIMTARQLCQMTSTDEDTMRVRFTKLHKTNPDLFPTRWRIEGELTPDQITELIKAGERKGSAPKQNQAEAVAHTAHIAMIPETGRPNEVAPQGMESKNRNRWQIVPLLIAFILPTIASLGNTYRVSHHLSNDATTSTAIMLVMSCVPLLFLWASVGKWVSVGAAVWLVLFEAFCNLSATYLALMGGMVYMFGQPRGECSPFLDSVCRLTSSGYQQTAFCLGLAVAFSLLAAQLTAFYELKKRI